MRGRTFQAIFTLFVLTIIGALNVNIFGVSVTLTYLPLVSVFLWPRYSKPIISIIAILISGFILDFLIYDPIGMKSLIYLTIFTLFRPDLRLTPHSFTSAFMQWMATAIIAFTLAYILGSFAFKMRPDVFALLYQMLIATAFFPVFYGLRHLWKIVFSDPHDRGL